MSWKKPFLHRILRGDLAGTYLPYAQSRLRALLALFGPDEYFAEKRIIGDYTIQIQQSPPAQYISIVQGGGLSYEFFTSEHVNNNTLGSPGHGSGIVNTYVCGSALRASFTGSRASSLGLYSTSIPPGLTDGWKSRDCEAPQGIDTGLRTWRAWQNQKFFEYAWHPNNDGKSLVTSTLAQAPGLAGQCNWMSPYNFARIASAGSKVSDFGLDVKPTLYTKSGTTSGAPALEQPWLYWRRAAVQTDSVSGRKFFISTDNYGRFQVYPVKDYSATGGIVPSGAYKVYTPPYPSWVSIPDPSDYTRQVNDWLWRFNKDATKCVSIPYSSDFSSGYYKNLYNEQFYATLLPDKLPLIDPAYLNAVVPAHEDTPGLVEFGIAINVIGPGDLDFDVTFTPLRSSYLPTNGRFFFDAAYFLPDVETTGIIEDTLMTAEVECSYPAGYYLANSGESPPHNLDLIRGMQADIVVYANDAVMVKTEKLRFTALTSFEGQFPTVAGYGPGGNTAGGIGGYVNFATGGAIVIASAGPVSYVAEPVGTGAKFARLYALELSTLSALYEADDEVAGTGFLSAVAYGTEFYRSTYSLGYTKTASLLPAPNTTVTSARLCQYALDTTLNTEWGMGFNVHPLGHWALGLDAELATNTVLANDLDWISVKSKDINGLPIRYRYQHKDLFNSAFKQTRDYTFYTTPFTGEGLWDQGSFRTQGIWVTFR